MRVRLTRAAEKMVRQGHPWVFSNSIREQNRPGQAGELAIVYDARDSFLAAGLFDPDSPIRIRVLQLGKPSPINAEWLKTRLSAAMDRRSAMFGNDTTGFRFINGESDGWPGLVLDQYEDVLVLKIYTGIWLPRLDEISELLRERFPSKALVLRLSRNIQKIAREQFSVTDGQILFGNLASPLIVFRETGLLFEADVVRGQKTGFFLDQRENRRIVESLARGRAGLNAFSFSGGFSVYAARGGASAVTDLDISAHALESSKRNFALNQARPPHRCIQADAFEWLASAKPSQFDLVILDPPSLAKSATDKPAALKGYCTLADLGVRQLRSGGILVFASCSAHVPVEEFFALARDRILNSAKRPAIEMQTTRQPPDHPASFPEASYLKCIYFKLRS